MQMFEDLPEAVRVIIADEFKLTGHIPMALRNALTGDADAWGKIQTRLIELLKMDALERAILAGAIKQRHQQQEVNRAFIQEQNRFFNRPTAKADLKEWSKAPFWYLPEALSLSFGKCPRIVTIEKVAEHDQVSPFAVEYMRRADFILRAHQSGQLPDKVAPIDFIAWLMAGDCKFPLELAEAVERYHVKSEASPTATPEPTTSAGTIEATNVSKSDEEKPDGGWTVKEPQRVRDSFTIMLHQVLKAAHSEGRPRPKPRQAMEAIKAAKHSDFIRLYEEEGKMYIEYYGNDGYEKVIDSDDVGDRIARLITKNPR